MQVDKQINPTFRILSVFLLIIILLYTGFRAYQLSLTHDEALSYIYFDHFASYQDIVTYAIPTTNNHMLNSLLMKFSTGLFGNSEFVIRLPALLGQALYLIGIYLILTLFLEGWLLVIGTLLLALNPLLIDYASCARGYSLGFGFLILGLYFLFKHISSGLTNSSVKQFAVGFWLLAFSVLGNLAFLNPYLAIVCFFGLIELYRLFFSPQPISGRLQIFFKKIILGIAPSSLFLAAIYIQPIIKLQKAHEFYHGDNIGFWQNTVWSLVNATIYDGKYFNLDLHKIVMGIIIISLVVGIVIIAKKIILKNSANQKERFLVFVLSALFICYLSIELQHQLLGTVYPFDRAAIYFVPLFLLYVLLLTKNMSKLFQAAFHFVVVILVVHFVISTNTTHFFFNKPDAHTKEMMRFVADATKDKGFPPRMIRLGIHWWFEPAINYYILRNNLTWIQFVDRKGPAGIFHFYYLREDDKSIIDQYHLKTLKKYDISNTYLASP